MTLDIRKDYRYILSHLRPGEAYHWKGGDPSDWESIGEWRVEGKEKPTKEECDKLWLDSLEAKAYNELVDIKRAEAYGSIAEQLDMQYWDRVNGTNNWQEHIERVKATYPKIVM